MVEYSVYRFLIVFLMDMLRPEDEDDLDGLLTEGCFDPDVIHIHQEFGHFSSKEPPSIWFQCKISPFFLLFILPQAKKIRDGFLMGTAPVLHFLL